MAKGNVPAKRKKPTTPEDDVRPEPVASTSAPTPSLPPPLSAVAARKAALAASAQSTPVASPSPPESEGEDSDDDEISLGVASDGEHEQQPAKGKRAARPKKKPKGAGRYFMAVEEGERERITGMDVDADGADPADDLGLEDEQELSKNLGKGKLGRGKRQRRERSAFNDPSCVSTFAPVLDENAFRVSWTETGDGSQQSGLLLCFQTSETLLVHGSVVVSPLFGSFTLLGSIITSPPVTSPLVFPPPTSHSLFAPSSHPLPPLEVLPLSVIDKSTSLLLPDGRTVDISSASAVVLLSDLGSGIEGVETVLRNGGLGAGNAMWDVGGKKAWGGAGWRLILDVTPSLTSMRTPGSWDSTLASLIPSRRQPKFWCEDDSEESEEEEDLSAGADRMVLMVEGPKHVGKSTFAKLVVNRLLSKYARVAYLDTDLGQPEFTTSGLVSLTVVDSPILGPSFTHPSIPVGAHFLGSPSPASDPSSYLSALTALIATYSLEVEYSLIDEPARRIGRRHGSARSATPASKIRDRVPLVVNTQGWVKGLGADLLEKLKLESRPTHLFSFDGADEDRDGEEHEDGPGCLRFRLEAAPASPLDAKWSAADLRTLSLVSYFHALFSRASSAAASPPNTIARTWDFSRPLVARAPLGVSWTEAEAITSVHILDSEVDYEQVLHALNGSVVALVRSTTVFDDLPPPTQAPTEFPYDAYAPPPNPATSKCLGLALVRSIDPDLRTLHLLSPVPGQLLDEGPVSLVKGALEIPVCLVLDFAATDADKEKGLCGVEWKDVPYFGGEGEGAGRRKVRRNLMRRGQA